MWRRTLLLLLCLICLQANSQLSDPRDTFTGTLQQKYNETVSRNTAQNYACGLQAPIRSFYSSRYGAVNLETHPEACGRCLQASCVDRTQCKSPFLNVTIVVIDNCLDCGNGVAMNSLAVRELVGRSLLEESEDDLQVQWTLFDCSATTQASPPPPALSPPPPPLPAPVLAAPKVEEAEIEAKAAPSPPPVGEEPASSIIEEEILVPEPAPEEIIERPPPSLTPTTLREADAESPQTELLSITTPAPEVEKEEQKQVETNAYSSFSSSEGGARAGAGGLPGKDVLTLPRVGNIGLALPVDYQPFPEQAFATIACGFASVSPYFKTHFAGMASTGRSDNENACGSCIAVRCANPAKCPYGTETVVQVVDTCGSCDVDDVNISPDAFKAVMGNTTSSTTSSYSSSDVRVTWRKVSCRGKTEGPLYLHFLSGGSNVDAYYAQMSLSNAAQEIKAVKMNEQSLARMSGIGGGRWEWSNNGNKLNLSLPTVMEVTGIDEKVVEMELQKFESQELSSNI